MKLLNRLFGKRNSGSVITITHNISNENYNQVASFVDNCVSMSDCKLANTMINDLGDEHPTLRNNLCDKTFNIFLETYENKIQN